MGAPTRDPRTDWGGPLELQSAELRRAVSDLQADLQALIRDLRWGPVALLRQQAQAYLSELRREFLRAHRRLLVQSRNKDERESTQDSLRRELTELAGRFRTVVLSRSSRVQQNGWTPTSLAEAVRKAVEALPRSVYAPYEARSLSPQPGDGFVRRWQRRLLRFVRWVQRTMGEKLPDRQVEVRELARYHLAGRAARQIEGLAALFVQSEVQLAGRSRQILEAIAQGFEALVAHVEQDDFPDMVSGLRIQLEGEFGSVEQEVGQILDDSLVRAEAIFGDALTAIKKDLPVLATVDLPSRLRRSATVVAEADRALADMANRLDRLRDRVAATYVLLALHLEFLGFRSRVFHTMDEVLAELRADVRGRSRVQLERVRTVVDEIVEGLKTLDASGRPKEDAEVRARVQPLEHIVEEASGVTRQLLDQLSAETAVTPLLEALNREAQSLTDRYQVPAGRIPRAEWKLPVPVALTEIEFAQVVSSFVQREVAPELLATTSRAVNRVLPILESFQDLERVVSFNAETFDDRVAVSADRGGQQLAEILQTTLQRGRDELTERLEEIVHWDEDLVHDIRQIVVDKIDELRRRLGEGDIGRARVVRTSDSTAQFLGWVSASSRRVRQVGRRQAAWLRQTVGEGRLAAWREALGLIPLDRQPIVDGAAWAPPRTISGLPVVYSRLFAGQARWAGDVISVADDEIRRAREALAAASPGLRGVALIGADAASRGALAGAVLRGGKPSRRLAFTQPTSVEQLRAALAEIGSPPIIQLGGLSWLVSARPGGCAPLAALLDVMVKEERRTAWLIEVDALVWDFASALRPLADVLSTQVRVPALTPKDLQRAILARHALSGYDLRFEIGDQVERLGHDRGVVQERFFKTLYAASGGLLQVALPLWLGSIGRVNEESSLLVITDEPRVPSVALGRLPEATWTMLFVIARQDWIDRQTLAFSLQIDEAAAEGRLAGLASLGLIKRQGRDVYQLRRHLRGAVLVGLKERGWIV